MTLKLYELTEEFEGLNDEERLHVLLDFAETLPDESGENAPLFGNEACRIQECQTPVFMRVGILNGKNGHRGQCSQKITYGPRHRLSHRRGDRSIRTCRGVGPSRRSSPDIWLGKRVGYDTPARCPGDDVQN